MNGGLGGAFVTPKGSLNEVPAGAIALASMPPGFLNIVGDVFTCARKGEEAATCTIEGFRPVLCSLGVDLSMICVGCVTWVGGEESSWVMG